MYVGLDIDVESTLTFKINGDRMPFSNGMAFLSSTFSVSPVLSHRLTYITHGRLYETHSRPTGSTTLLRRCINVIDTKKLKINKK